MAVKIIKYGDKRRIICLPVEVCLIPSRLNVVNGTSYSAHFSAISNKSLLVQTLITISLWVMTGRVSMGSKVVMSISSLNLLKMVCLMCITLRIIIVIVNRFLISLLYIVIQHSPGTQLY